MDEFKWTGGARIGNTNTTWPFAKLLVTNELLEIQASIVGHLVFRPQDIISVEVHQSFPLIGHGVKINHKVSNYNENVIFWTMADPEIVINQIRKTGFLDKPPIDAGIEDSEVLLERQKSGAFPIRKPIAIGLVVLWNLLIMMDFATFFLDFGNPFFLGFGTVAALGIILLTTLLTLLSKDFAKLVLKKGRTVQEIKLFLYFLLVILGFMLSIFIFIIW